MLPALRRMLPSSHVRLAATEVVDSGILAVHIPHNAQRADSGPGPSEEARVTTAQAVPVLHLTYCVSSARRASASTSRRYFEAVDSLTPATLPRARTHAERPPHSPRTPT